MKPWTGFGIGIALVALIAAAAVLARPALTRLRKPPSKIPTARVERGPLELRVYTIGELRPVKTVMLAAPPVGGVLQIVHLAKSGTHVNPGESVVEFDPSEQEYNLEQAKSQLEEADQEIVKTKADAAVRMAEDKVALLSARFELRRAELAVQGNDLLSGIEARMNVLSLDEAKRRLEQLEQDVKSRTSSNAADLAVAGQKRAKAMIAIHLAQQNINNMQLRAPIAGVVAVAQNVDAAGGIFFPGIELPEYREGDQTSPGRLIAHVLDVEQMEIQAKVTETDRGNLESGQQIEARVDALPLQRFAGKIKSLAGMAASGAFFSDTSAVRSFDASFEFKSNGVKLNPGCTAQVTIQGGTVKDALSLPRQALFRKEGKPCVYVKEAQGWKPTDVQVKHLTESRIVVEGISQGTEVALVNPEVEKGLAAGKAGGISSMLGGMFQ